MHDSFYKHLFSFRRTIEDLVRACSPYWADRIDFTTLRELSAEYVKGSQHSRYGDMLWEASLRGGEEGKVLIPVEFQSTRDYSIPLRLLDYGTSALVDAVKRRENPLAPGDKADLLLPVLLYSGPRRWNAPTNLADLMPTADPKLLVNQPLYEHFLIEERRGGTSGLPPGSLVTGLVGVVRARTAADVLAALAQLHDWLGDDRDGPLDRALAAWAKRLLTDLHAPESELAGAMTLKEVLEVIKPTRKWAKRWYEDGVDEGLEEGLEKGLEEGLEKGQVLVLRKLATRKFGLDTAGELSRVLDQFMEPERIEEVANAVLDCDTGEEFLARVREG